jgi:hypothetical protein
MSLIRPFNSQLHTKDPIYSAGYTMPVVALFVLAFLVAPLGFWIAGSHDLAQRQVQGAVSVHLDEGVYVKIISGKGSWDLFQYLCKTQDECTQSLSSGRKWESLSGGITEGSSKRLNYSDTLNGYQFIKVFVKSGWGSSDKNMFRVDVTSLSPEVEMVQIDGADAVLIPVDVIKAAAFKQIIFSDQL